jgi:hypothetical protein
MNTIIDNTIYGIRSIINPLFVNDLHDDNESDTSAAVDSDATTENMNNVNQNETNRIDYDESNNVINDHEIVSEYQNTLTKQSSGLQCDKYLIITICFILLCIIIFLIYIAVNHITNDIINKIA